ncbi:MAG: transcription factor S [Nanoarchaeota archaeon]|nr:transcription factor S [Nanoarchaeota archaeon]
MFCKKCGSILIPKKEGNKTVLKCSCGYKSKDMETTVLREEVKKKGKISVVEEEFETMPLTEAECPKCHHKKAYFWEVQTRAADEAPTKFLKCEKCRHIWRDYN